MAIHTGTHRLLERKDIDPHTEAIISSSLGWMYYELNDKERAMIYLIRAAIGDIRSATKETTALRVLAGLLYERGDINRANNYVRLHWKTPTSTMPATGR